MSVLKRNSVYFGGGVDISNSIELPKPQTHTAAAADPGAVERLPEPAPTRSRSCWSRSAGWSSA